jgi:hypothetical protein
MEERLDKALSQVLGAQVSPKETVPSPKAKSHGVSELGGLALKYYNKAQDYLRQGNWAGYGRELEHLENILNEMSGITKEEE